MQLFCLTYAGGTAAFYNQLESYLKNNINVIKLEYAGHGERHNEPFYRDFDELADDLYEKIKSELDNGECYALMGYSMGSISVVEILKRIISRKEIKLPCHVFLAAHEPIPKMELTHFSVEEADEFVKKRTISFGGIPDRLVNNKSFWRIYLPIYRNDYSIIGKYRFELLSLKTDISTTVFYSPTDTKPKDMELWRQYFIGKVDFFEYTGNHFFINEHCEEISSIIKENLVLED